MTEKIIEIHEEDFGPSKPVDLDDMFGPEPEPPRPMSPEAARQLAAQWNLKEEKTDVSR